MNEIVPVYLEYNDFKIDGVKALPLIGNINLNFYEERTFGYYSSSDIYYSKYYNSYYLCSYLISASRNIRRFDRRIENDLSDLENNGDKVFRYKYMIWKD
jgi:hypothetical protein